MKTTLLLGAALALASAGCKDRAESSKTKPDPPAKIERLPVETEISRITLTADAQRRLGIALATVTQEQVERRRTFGGDVTIPLGKAIIVSAPVPGKITAPQQGQIPLPGHQVTMGDPVMTLAPLLSPERYVPTPAEHVQMANARATLLSAFTVAEGDAQRGKAEVKAAQIALDRASQLLSDKAGSAKAVDDVRAQLNVAQSTLTAAEQRTQQLEKLLASLDAKQPNGQASELPMTAPQTGVMRSLLVTPGQTVTAGAALFEVVDIHSMWVRVPIYVDLLPEIRAASDARIVGLDGRSRLQPRRAEPVVAPPSADALSTTADLYFKVDNAEHDLRPGQRVGVEVALKGQQTGLVVPAAAIIYDIYGGAWVYVSVGDRAYQRQRVLIRFSDGDRVVLAKGPAPGVEIVVAGAAELYGAEFGAGK